MEYVFSTIMFIFGGILLLYAGELAIFKSPKLIPRSYASRMKDPKGYTVQFAKVIAVVSLPFLAAGIIGLFQWYIPAAIVLIGGFIGACVIASKLMKDHID